MTLNMVGNCGGYAFLIIGVFSLLLFAGAMHSAGATGTNDRAHIVCVFTMQNCPPCEKLKAHMKKHGIQQGNPTVTKEMPAVGIGFPAVCYDLNGKAVWDNGERIYEGRYWLPEKPVTRVHWTIK